MPDQVMVDIGDIYNHFQAPMTKFNCGNKCAPYNENGVPFCCDTRYAVPVAYRSEWEYFQANTDLWRLWEAADPSGTACLSDQISASQILLACKGHRSCQRNFRTITCRSFPFFPYVNSQGIFIGLSYYWEYEDRCWVINNLEAVTPAYTAEFMAVYDDLFETIPEELEAFRHHSALMRENFIRRRRSIPLLHRNGYLSKVNPETERSRHLDPDHLSKFGPYRIASQLPFPDELEY